MFRIGPCVCSPLQSPVRPTLHVIRRSVQCDPSVSAETCPNDLARTGFRSGSKADPACRPPQPLELQAQSRLNRLVGPRPRGNPAQIFELERQGLTKQYLRAKTQRELLPGYSCQWDDRKGLRDHIRIA